MKTWKFTLSFLAASIMANSPLAWAATDLNQKKEFNKYLKEQVMANGASLNSFYQNTKVALNNSSKAWIEAGLKNSGNESLPALDTQTIKDKNGDETTKIILTKDGSTLTLVLDSKDQDHFTINGQKFYYLEAMNIPMIINRLAATDSSLKALATEMNSQAQPARSVEASDYLSTDQFLKLSPLKKVEYLQLWRGVLEAAQNVNYNQYGAQNESSAETYAGLHPLLASMVAWAAVPANGTECLIAGNISTYTNGRCKIDSNNFYNKQCGQGKVACNPLVYGVADDGPYCLDSKQQPDFTLRATSMCNEKSPLKGEPGSPERNKSYKRILVNYLMSKGQAPTDLASCFNQENKIDVKCKSIFEPQLLEFEQLKRHAEGVCNNVTLPDQPGACKSLSERTMELITFTKENNPPVVNVPLVSAKSAEQLDCEKNIKNNWNQNLKKCEKAPEVKMTAPEKPVPVEKEKKKKSLLGLFLVGIGIALAWLFTGRKHHPTVTVTTLPQTTTPSSEGGSGTNSNGSNGGVRSTGGSQ